MYIFNICTPFQNSFLQKPYKISVLLGPAFSSVCSVGDSFWGVETLQKHPLPGDLAEGVKSLLQFESTDLLMEQAARVFQPPAKAERNWSWGHTLLNSGICGNRGLERL